MEISELASSSRQEVLMIVCEVLPESKVCSCEIVLGRQPKFYSPIPSQPGATMSMIWVPFSQLQVHESCLRDLEMLK